MKTRIAILLAVALLAALPASAANYLFTTNAETAAAFVADLDAVCGYPNPATATDHAVAVQVVKDGFLVIVPDGVWAPKLKAALDAKVVLPADRKADAPVETAKAVTDKLTALVSEGKVKPPKEGAVDKQNFVLVAQLLADEKAIASADVKPIDAKPTDEGAIDAK